MSRLIQVYEKALQSGHAMESGFLRNQRLAGRESELALLTGRFHAGGGITLVSGEPGIGKSRLLEEIEGIARKSGAVVLKGGSVDAAGLPPYLPFIEALGDFCQRTDPAQLQTLIQNELPALITLLPELSRHLAQQSIQSELGVEQARLRLFEAVMRFVSAIAAERRALLILDDLQWADSATIDLLHHLVRRSDTPKLAIVGAYRENEIDRNGALKRGLVELNRLRKLTTIPLRRLDSAALQQLTGSLLACEISPAAFSELHRQSEGNPFFAEELLRGWSTSGVLELRDGQWRLKHPPGEVESVIDATRERLSALSSETRQLLRTAAIIGRTFESTLLGESSGIGEESLESEIEPAVGLGLVAVSPSGDYTFTHDKIRETLYLETTPIRRRRLHGFIGHALEQRGGTQPTMLSALAFHFANSGDRGRGADYATRAMKSALSAFAIEEAMKHGRIALELTPVDSAQRGSLLESLANVHLLAGETAESAEHAGDGAQWFLDRGDRPGAARLLRQKGTALWRQESISVAEIAFGRALELLGEEITPEAVGILSELGTLKATGQLKSDEGISLARRALEGAVALARTDLEAITSRALGNLLVRANRVEEGLPLLNHALDLASSCNDLVEATECCACLVTAYYWKGDAKGFVESALRQVEFAEASHDLFQLRHVYCWLAAAATVMGNSGQSEQFLRRQAEVLDQLGLPEPRAYFDVVTGMILCWQGRIEEAEEPLRRGIDSYRLLDSSALIWHLGQYAALLHLLGREDEAIQCRDEVERSLADCPPESPVIPEALTTLLQIAIDTHDIQRLQRYRSQLLPFSGRLANNLIDRTLGMIATFLGDWTDAERYLEQAERQASEFGFTLELARTMEQQAILSLRHGGKSSSVAARSLFERAAATYELAGLPILAAQTRSQVAAAERRTGESPSGLSQREIQVLSLLAAGKSNRQIAGDLYISEKTVANHITAIFTKTNTNNRVEAATYALRHLLTAE